MRASMTAGGRLASLLLVLLMAVVVGCGSGDDDDGGDAKRPESVPSGAVAVIGGQQVMNPELKRQIAILRRAQRRAGGKKLSAEQRKQLASQALAQLLMRKALEQEARERGVKVDMAEVRRDWRRAARRQFKTKKALRRFLGGQTVADIVAQLRLQALTEKIHAQVAKDAGGGKDGAKAVKEFQQEFQERWQGQTACREGYSAPGCG